jgi:hypothetical protein
MELTFKEYKLRSQLFAGAVSDIIGIDKTMELMKEANEIMLKIKANEREKTK